jgi:hypothetical protein
MTTFGTSSYLKIVSLRPRPQRTEIVNRLLPSEDAYDFHRSLRRLVKRIVINGEPFESALAAAYEITQPPERTSAIEGLNALNTWLQHNHGQIMDGEARVISSPNNIFKVKFSPDFIIQIGGYKTAFHIWNTKKPELDPRMMFGSLSLFVGSYREIPEAVNDLAILSLRNSELYRLSQVPDHRATGMATIQRLERIFQEVQSELRSHSPSLGDRPDSPPPAE